MKKVLIAIFPILFLGLLFNYAGIAKSPPADIPLKTLLPVLDGYDFELALDLNKEDLIELHKNITKQFGIPVSEETIEKGEFFPIEKIIAAYKKDDKEIFIKIDKFMNKEFAKKEFERRIKNAKELQSKFKYGNTEVVLKEVSVNKHTAYYQIFGGEIYDRKYETKLFWVNGLYFFEVLSHGEDFWPEIEAIMIAEKIKYKHK